MSIMSNFPNSLFQVQSHGHRRRGAAVVSLLLSASPSQPHSESASRRRSLLAWQHSSSAVRPLDLKLDDSDPAVTRVYQVGHGGFLEPYDLHNYQQDFPIAGEFQRHPDGDHVQSPRIRRGINVNRDEYQNVQRRVELLRKDSFKYTLENDPYEQQEVSPAHRHLQYYDLSSLHHGKQHHTESSLHSEDPHQRYRSGQLTTATATTTIVQQTTYRDATDGNPPVVRSTFPPKNTLIGQNQSFGALVTDNGSGVKSVCLQFKDQANARSDCLELINVGAEFGVSDVWELSFGGFDAHQGETWAFRIRSKDGGNNRINTEWSDFIINIQGRDTASVTTPATTNVAESVIDAAPPAPGAPLLREVRDEEWSFGGVIQTSTGRILFFLDDNPYVCTGTVLQDDIQDRTIILTAAHCAYQYQPGGGRFAEHALFIPNQDDTTGLESDELCSNDPLGCWIPAFAVVDYRWTQQGFPNSVPYDYAFYVISNDASVHEKGYLHMADPLLSSFLPDLVEPIPINFNFDPEGDFTTGLGYSFDKDPDFRYCAGELSGKFGIPTYENLWLGVCEMTGGSSGGPWMIDLDSNGRGTVVSVNSWGYTSSSGMAGPNLSTMAGSTAECLYERAKSKPIDAPEGGYIVYDC